MNRGGGRLVHQYKERRSSSESNVSSSIRYVSMHFISCRDVYPIEARISLMERAKPDKKTRKKNVLWLHDRILDETHWFYLWLAFCWDLLSFSR